MRAVILISALGALALVLAVLVAFSIPLSSHSWTHWFGR